MIKKISSYKELLEEKERLERLFDQQKQVIRDDISAIGEEFKPVGSALSFAGKLVTRDSNNLLLNLGANKVIDLVVRQLLLSRAGWLVRLAVPFFVKNYSSHLISENKDKILRKLFSFVGKKNSNGKAEVAEK